MPLRKNQPPATQPAATFSKRYAIFSGTTAGREGAGWAWREILCRQQKGWLIVTLPILQWLGLSTVTRTSRPASSSSPVPLLAAVFRRSTLHLPESTRYPEPYESLRASTLVSLVRAPRPCGKISTAPKPSCSACAAMAGATNSPRAPTRVSTRRITSSPLPRSAGR